MRSTSRNHARYGKCLSFKKASRQAMNECGFYCNNIKQFSSRQVAHLRLKVTAEAHTTPVGSQTVRQANTVKAAKAADQATVLAHAKLAVSHTEWEAMTAAEGPKGDRKCRRANNTDPGRQVEEDALFEAARASESLSVAFTSISRAGAPSVLVSVESLRKNAGIQNMRQNAAKRFQR